MEEEPFFIDDATRGALSRTDATISDVVLATTVALPVVAEAIHADHDALPKAVVYTEAIGVGLLLDTVAKYLVDRPRPYVYRNDGTGFRYVAHEGDDAYLSFFSGHSTTAFAAATAGCTLFAYESRVERRAPCSGEQR